MPIIITQTRTVKGEMETHGGKVVFRGEHDSVQMSLGCIENPNYGNDDDGKEVSVYLTKKELGDLIQALAALHEVMRDS